MANKENELNENDLEFAVGGSGEEIFDANQVKAQYPDAIRVKLTDGYYANSYGEGPKYTAAVGWKDLYILKTVDLERKAPHLIGHGTVAIGWAPSGSFIPVVDWD